MGSSVRLFKSHCRRSLSRSRIAHLLIYVPRQSFVYICRLILNTIHPLSCVQIEECAVTHIKFKSACDNRRNKIRTWAYRITRTDTSTILPCLLLSAPLPKEFGSKLKFKSPTSLLTRVSSVLRIEVRRRRSLCEKVVNVSVQPVVVPKAVGFVMELAGADRVTIVQAGDHGLVTESLLITDNSGRIELGPVALEQTSELG